MKKSHPAKGWGLKKAIATSSQSHEDIYILKSLYTVSQVGFAFIDTKGIYKKINRTLAEINGVPPSHNSSKTISQVNPTYAKAYSKIIRKVIKTKKPLTIEHDGYTNKEKRWREEYFPVFEGKKLIGVNSIVIDITEYKKTEEALQRERNLLQSVMDGAGQSHLVYLDRNFNFVRVNQTYAKTCGYRPDEMVGKNHFVLYPNEENEAIFKRVRDTGVAAEYHDKPFVFPDQPDRGVTYWDWTLQPIKDGAGVVQGLVFSLTETTQRKRAEEELEKVATYPIQNPNPIIEVDLQGNITFMNPAAKKSFPDLMAQGIKHKILMDWSSLINMCRGSSKKLPEREVMANDRWYHQTFYYSSVTKGLRVYVLDVTARKQTEDFLSQSEKKYRLLFENMTEMFQILEPIFSKRGKVVDFRYIEVNIATEKVVGKKRVEIEGKTAKELWGIVEGYWLKMLEKVLRTGKPNHMENYNKALDAYWDVYCWRVNEKRVAIVFTDISKYKKTYESFMLAHKKLQNIIDNSPSIIYAFDRQERFVLANSAVAKLFHTTTEKIIGRKRDEFMPKKDAYWHEANDKKVFDKRRAIEFEEYSKLPGRSITWLTHKFPLTDHKGHIYAIGGISTDITERKKAEEALKELDRRKDEFISIASHELKTPMTSLKAYSQIVSRKLKKSGDAQTKVLIDRIEEQTDRLTRLVSDLLDVTKLAANKMLLPKEPVDLNKLVEETVSDICTTTNNTVKVYSIKIKGKVRKPVTVDRFRIGQVLTNLLTNAVKYSPNSNKIIVKLSSSKTEAKVAVKDYGIGILPEDQVHIFERFFQAKPAKNQEGRFTSLGLGLYITSEIVKRHRGKIWVESNPGKGSTFFFTLPFKNNEN